MNSILFYITGHGYGHAVRSSQVIRSLKQNCPESTIIVRSTAPQWLFEHPRYPILQTHQSIDVGIVQQDSLQMELRKTLDACQALHNRSPELIEKEAAFVKHHDVRLIVGDIPPLCFEIAARAGLPSVAISNFSWSGIYRGYLGEYPEFLPLVEEMVQFYRKATLALTLPYPCEMEIFPKRQTIPLITRCSALDKKAARDKFGLPASATVVLLSFGGHGLERIARENLLHQKKFFFVGTGQTHWSEGNLRILPNRHREYVDLIRAADAVVSKPGYGIVADIIRHQIPLLYTDRGDFAEYPCLVNLLKDWATTEFITQEDLLAGNLSFHLERLFAKEPHWPAVAVNGADVAAEKIAGLIG